MDSMNKKEQLINEGYLIGSIQFDEKIESLIKDIIEFSNNPINLECRYDITRKGLEKIHKGTNCTYEESLVYDEYIKTTDKSNYNIYQKWFLIKDNGFFKRKPFAELSYEIIKDLYDFKTMEDIFNMDDFTMYNDDCFIIPHADNKDDLHDRVCVVLLYLNKDIPEDGVGGELIVKNQKGEEIIVKPTYGTYVILDFTQNNLVHRVSKVKDYKRYAYVNFVHKK